MIDGGGDVDDTWPTLAHFLAAVDGGPVGVVPAARPRERWDEALEDGTDRLGAHDHDRVDPLTDLEPLGLDDLRATAGVYVVGGDPGRLVARLERAGVAGLLGPFVGGGGPLYVEGSAAPAVGATSADDEDAAGLDLLSDWDVRVGYEGDRAAQLEAAEAAGRPRLAVPPRSGVAVVDGTVDVVGYEPVLAIRDGAVERLVMDDELALDG